MHVGRTFNDALAIVLPIEGGYGNDPHDSGGETKFGISQAAFPDLDIKSLTLEKAVALYRKFYWDQFHCGELPWALALVLFDSVVQFNPLRPVTWLQVAVGARGDGFLGPVTIQAASDCPDPGRAALSMMVARGEYRTTRPDYEHFGHGWRMRDMTVLFEAVRADF
jgi:lysozyme family protein